MNHRQGQLLAQEAVVCSHYNQYLCSFTWTGPTSLSCLRNIMLRHSKFSWIKRGKNQRRGSQFFQGTWIFTWKNGKNYGYLDLGTGRQFLKKYTKWASRKLHFKQNNFLCVANDKIQTCSLKFEFWKICVRHHELNSFPILKDFSLKIGGDTNKCYLLICKMKQRNTKICIAQWIYFPNDQSMMLQNHALVKNTFRSARWTKGF